MKYFIDTEFIEGFHKPLFGKRRHFIDLISIGIIAEDGRTYYAISTEFNPKDASPWVKDNVILKLPEKYADFYDSPRIRQEAMLWKSNQHIADDIKEFVFDKQINLDKDNVKFDNPEFYAYYADYDWVVFCSLFGTMMDLPMGLPMYCKDLKQMMDETASLVNQVDLTTHLFAPEKSEKGSWELAKGASVSKDIINIDDYSFGMKLELLKSMPNYPKQQNEHSALDDAKWNFELHKFLQDINQVS